MLVEIENQIFLGGWDNGSAREALTLQAQEPAFDPQNLCKRGGYGGTHL